MWETQLYNILSLFSCSSKSGRLFYVIYFFFSWCQLHVITQYQPMICSHSESKGSYTANPVLMSHFVMNTPSKRTSNWPRVCNICMVASVCMCISERLGKRKKKQPLEYAQKKKRQKKKKTTNRNSTTLVCLLHTETRVDAVLIKQPVGALSELEKSAR